VNVFLMHPDHDLVLADEPRPAHISEIPRLRDPVEALHADLAPSQAALVQDLDVETLVEVMAAGDIFLYRAAWHAVLASLDDPEAIRFRQQVLADTIAQPAAIRKIYDIAVAAIEGEQRDWVTRNSTHAETALRRSLTVLGLFLEQLRQLRRIADQHRAAFRSAGLTRFFDMVAAQLDDPCLGAMGEHLDRLRLRGGLQLRAQLGALHTDTTYALCRPRTAAAQPWRERLGLGGRSAFTYEVSALDRHELEALGELRERGIALVADALEESVDDLLAFFRQLRAEVGFYLGCLNLREELARRGVPTCFPDPEPAGPVLSAQGLCEPSLGLRSLEPVVGNDLAADGALLVVVTGANGGGKSTFLRSVGLAQLMMQCGMFVAARSFQADLRSGIFTHFKREEAVTLKSGKLDEELGRMSDIVDLLRPTDLVLLNESFAATNKREGSEIARQIVRALLRLGVKVVYVTHMHDLAAGFAREALPEARFLRAERLPDGRRTYRIVPGEPQPTSHGEDVYRRVFGAAPDASQATGADTRG
jgi:hypothetical protein